MAPQPTTPLERAAPRDAASLTDIAHQAKRYWGYPEEWIVAWKDQLTLDQAYIQSHPVFTIRDPDPIGFYALTPLDNDDRWELDHLWVLPSAMGHGHGRALLRHASDQARLVGASSLRILSDPHAEGFYRRLGARTVGRIDAAIGGIQRWLPEMELSLG